MLYSLTPISSREGDQSTGCKHFCLSPLLFHHVCRHQSWVSAPELDLLDICHLQPTPLMCFLWVDPPGCSRHVLGIFCTSSCSHPASRNHLAEGLRVSQANLPMMICQKSMDDSPSDTSQSQSNQTVTDIWKICNLSSGTQWSYFSASSCPVIAQASLY